MYRILQLHSCQTAIQIIDDVNVYRLCFYNVNFIVNFIKIAVVVAQQTDDKKAASFSLLIWVLFCFVTEASAF